MTRVIREKPDYYDTFVCTGNTTCIDSCCFAWDLPMDDETAALYQSYEGAFGEYLRRNIFQDEKGNWYIKQKEHGRCPFLTEDNLCEVRLKAGEKAQIKICDIYPRERDIRAGHYRQDRLLIACSEVARLLYAATGERLRFVTETQETEEDIPKELQLRTERLLAFRDGFVEALQAGAYDGSIFGGYETAEEVTRFLDAALYFEGHQMSEDVFARIRKLLDRVDIVRESFYASCKEAKAWMRRSGAYFAHRLLLDTLQDGNVQGPLLAVFRSVHLLELICLAVFDKKGSFDLEDMVFCGHIFSLTFEISMHNIALLKEMENAPADLEYPNGENSELRPFLYP